MNIIKKDWISYSSFLSGGKSYLQIWVLVKMAAPTNEPIQKPTCGEKLKINLFLERLYFKNIHKAIISERDSVFPNFQHRITFQ